MSIEMNIIRRITSYDLRKCPAATDVQMNFSKGNAGDNKVTIAKVPQKHFTFSPVESVVQIYYFTLSVEMWGKDTCFTLFNDVTWANDVEFYS